MAFALPSETSLPIANQLEICSAASRPVSEVWAHAAMPAGVEVVAIRHSVELHTDRREAIAAIPEVMDRVGTTITVRVTSVLHPQMQ